jgi:GTPase involved in cell partitioning and DNA repair
LLEKPQLVAANKIDALDDPKRLTALEKRAKKLKLKFFRISAVTREGVNDLIEAAWPIIVKGREEERSAVALEDQEAEADHSAQRSDSAKAPSDRADYNPALVPPLRAGGTSKPRKKQHARKRS